MCDYREGELILAWAEQDSYGSKLADQIDAGEVEQVRWRDSLRRRLNRSGTESTIPLYVHLLNVPEGQELWSINQLHRRYRELAPPGTPSPMIVPNSYLTLEGFSPSNDHATYKNMLGSMQSGTGSGVNVAIVDSGMEPGSVPTARVVDLVTPNGSGNDFVGHGTAVANVIRDVAPAANVEVIKVTDSRMLVEWDGLAGLDVASRADVINLSLSFGNATRYCTNCGRQSISSRSIVFERMVELALQKPHQPVIVAAAGNQAKRELRYPARFADVVAIGAVDVNADVTPYSNYGAANAAGQWHANLFFAPGGEMARPVGTTTAPLPGAGHFGTSLATAYASGVIACARQTRGAARAQLLTDLRSAARRLRNHVPADHGNGLLQGC